MSDQLLVGVRRRGVAAVLAFACTLSVLLLAGPLSRADAAQRTGIRIQITALPAGVKARVKVSGRGTSRTVTSSRVVSLPGAGRYKVSAAPVAGAGGTYYALTPKPVKVGAGRVVTVKVSYGTFLPETTKVVPETATASLQGEPGSTRTLTLTGAAAQTAAPGQILASGVSPGAPEGYLVKVLSVNHEGAGAVAQVQDATLLEAVPNGEVNSEAVASGTAASAGEPAGRSARARAASAGDWLKCSAGAAVQVQPIKSFPGPKINFNAKWGLFSGLTGVRITASLNEKVGVKATASAGASCGTPSPGHALLPRPYAFGAITFFVGPVPVVIVPELQFYLFGTASIQANAEWSLTQEASAEIGVEYNRGAITPIHNLHNSFTQHAEIQGSASSELALRPTLALKLYGLVGPNFDVGVAAKLKASTQANPWWKLEGCLQAGVGFQVDLLGIHDNWSRPHLVEACRTLLHANGPFQGTPKKTEPEVKQPSEPKEIKLPSGPTGGVCKRYETVGFETKCAEY